MCEIDARRNIPKKEQWKAHNEDENKGWITNEPNVRLPSSSGEGWHDDDYQEGGGGCKLIWTWNRGFFLPIFVAKSSGA